MESICKRLIVVILCLFCFGGLHSQIKDTSEIIYKDSIFVTRPKPINAAAEVVGYNVGLWTFNRYAMNVEYAHINLQTMKSNLQHSFVWDNDYFSTNYFLHPYQGGLYFNTARSNGLSFGASMFYSLGGSLTWEYLMENEPPSFNDIITTPISGVLIGEVMFKMSNRVIDSRAVGWERFGRELLGFVINPVNGFNRIISGNAWKRSNYSGKMIADSPTDFSITSGYRGLYANNVGSIDNSAYIGLHLLYGDAFSDENEKPYDNFTFSATLNILGNQPILADMNILGEIWGENISLKNDKMDLHWGVFQHFYYYESESPKDNLKTSMYRFAEAASFGLGGRFRADISDKTNFETGAYINGIVLGSNTTDYYNLYHRDYNYGSGFSTKLNASLVFNERTSFEAGIENYQMYSWKGYALDTDFSQLTDEEQFEFDVQGDESSTNFMVTKLKFNHWFSNNVLFSIGTSSYKRQSNYRFFENKRSNVTDYQIGLGYTF